MKTLAIAAIFCLSGVAYANSPVHKASAATASDQGMTQSDTDTTRSIRQKIHQDQNISMMGKNVTIISKDGMVTVKGPVASMAEKNKISRIATDVAGKTIADEMTISK